MCYEVTRYNLHHHDEWLPSEMVESEAGDYVLYEEYAELKAKYDELLKEKTVYIAARG